jgi:hypothetical protein
MEALICEIAVSPAHKQFTPFYSQSGVTITFIVRGEKGVVSLMVGTGWYADSEFHCKPSGSDLSFHSAVRLPDMQECPGETCTYLGNVKGYRYTSGLVAQMLVDVMIKQGSEGVFKYLEAYYHRPSEIENTKNLISLNAAPMAVL